jgi:ribosomal protein S18 acetylase RimI-like enzyme
MAPIPGRPNQRLQRTGGQRRFAAWWPSQRLVVVRPPPLNRRSFVGTTRSEMSAMHAVIRRATAADAHAIGALAKEFQAYLRALGDRTQFEFTAETYLRDGFGPHPAFLVAELDGEVIGYLLYHFGYDTDRAMRLLHVIDLYVQASKRRRGIGEALMRAAARSAGRLEDVS